MQGLLIVSGWLISAALTFIVSFGTLQFILITREVDYIPGDDRSSHRAIMSAQHMLGSILGIKSATTGADARPVLVSNFLIKYQSPLQPYEYWGEYLVSIADQYDMDYRLLPAMAMQESNLCKRIPAGSYNCLGLGVHSRGTWGFESYEDSFAMAAKILKENYINIGLDTPDKIVKKYTPSSNGSWEFSVNMFMAKIAAGQ